MKKFIPIFSALVLIIWFTTSCSSDDNTVPEPDVTLEAEVRLNVSYGSHPRQVYDLYLPEGRTQENTKVIVLLHGGGWTSGDKSDMSNFVDFLKQNHPDYAIANINYVLAELGVPAFPNQFLDLGKVIEQLTAQQHDLQIQPQFGLIGTSAGAHISLMYDYVYDTGNQVKFVANIVGPTDFTDPFYANNPNFSVVLQLLTNGSAYPPGINLAEAVSPFYQVSTSSSPTIMFYGIADPIVPISNGISLETALSNASVTNLFHSYNGGHGDDWSEADKLDLALNLESFILLYLPL
jgi:acetyl esterase/lipase